MAEPDYLFWDTETYSEVELKNGSDAYSEDRSAEVMLFAYAFNDEEIEVIDLTADEKLPQRVLDAFADPRIIKVGHNIGMFDAVVVKNVLGIDIDPAQMHDTMVQAMCHALPGGLHTLCEVFALDADMAKDAKGKQLIQLFCKPQPKNRVLRRATRYTHPVEWQQFKDYAGSDIRSMRVLMHKMPKWNYEVPPHDLPIDEYNAGMREHYLWQLDQQINRRGFRVDTELARACIEQVADRKTALAEDMNEATKGEVRKATQRDALLKYILREHGVLLPDFKKSTLERRVEDATLPRAVRELLAIRLDAVQTSTSKYTRLMACVSWDGRLRGTLQFSGAGRTRRWAGRKFQPQNLPRPPKAHKKIIPSAIRAFKAHCVDVVFKPKEIMALASSCVRGVIIPSEGKKLVVSDLSNIEGRFAAWFAGEEWKLQAFRDYDNGIGPDLYVKAYAQMFGCDPAAVEDLERQIGKVCELFMQYEGGVGAWLTGALTYNIDLDYLAEVAWPEIPHSIKLEAQGFYDWTTRNRRTTFGLPPEVFMACEALKRLWRNNHPAISTIWRELSDAARKAIANQGVRYPVRNCVVVCKGAWLRIIMPSGASLCYPSPRIEDNTITYAGQNQYTKKWGRSKTYGGKLFENICQSGAGDVLKYNMPRIDFAGYDILLSVHDELITEAENSTNFSVDELSGMLATPPLWAPDIPLAAAGYEDMRYRKD